MDGNVVGTDGSTLTLPTADLAPGDHALTVEVRGLCGPAVTNAATLTIQESITANAPTDLLTYPGQGASFGTSASGGGPLSYQWRKNGLDIPGATEPTLTIPSVTDADAATYSVVVTGPCNTLTNSATLTILDCMPMLVGSSQLNLQTGLFEQKVQITNSTKFTFPALRVSVSGLSPGVQVYNASGDIDGMPFVQFNQPLGPDQIANLTIEYYVPDRKSPDSQLCAQPVSTSSPTQRDGTPIRIERALGLADGTFLIEFAAVPGQAYYIQYCDDFLNWKTVTPSITTEANRIQWIDNGPPKTLSHPSAAHCRFYRVITTP